MIEDFRSDTEFLCNAEELFREAVVKYTDGTCIASDGLSLDSVNIDVGNSIDIRFRLHFLDTPNGYGEAPARFLVARQAERDDTMLATLSCGLKEPDGCFWYDATIEPTSEHDWACSVIRSYGPSNISSWIHHRYKNRGEP